MPVELQWHPALPVLVATYSGMLSAKEYYAMCDRRLKMLLDGPEQVILVADTQPMEGFRDALAVDLRENILLHDKVYCTLIVLAEDLHHKLARAMLSDRYPVQFFPDSSAALDFAETLIAEFN